MGAFDRISNSLGLPTNSTPTLPRPSSPTPAPSNGPLIAGMTRSNSFPVMAMKMMTDTFSQPVWGPEISTAGAYSREGYTSKTFDIPYTPFKSQELALQTDEDVQLAINDLSAKITGSDHYWKAMDDQTAEYMKKFSHDIQFDIKDTEMVRELLWYGNTVYKPRLGIQYIRDHNDIMHIPISSFVRIWWDRQRVPYKYEFRGSEYQGYHNPRDIIHLTWNHVNASAFGSGFGVTMTTTRNFNQITPAGPVQYQLPSLLDRKYATQMNLHISERRYLPHNVYWLPGSSAEDRAQANADLANLAPGQDIVLGLNGGEVSELGSAARAINPQYWADITMAQIFKALNDSRGKNTGEAGHQYANAKTAALLDEIGLANFPNNILIQLIEKLFKPWFESNPLYSMNYGGGLVSMPWDECKFELNFGRVEKKNLPPDVLLQFLQFGFTSGALPDPIEIRDIMEEAGVGLKKEYTASLAANYNPMMPGMPQAVPPQGNNFNSNAGLAPRPMDHPAYNDHDNPTNRFPSPHDEQPSSPRLNFTIKKKRVDTKPFL